MEFLIELGLFVSKVLVLVLGIGGLLILFFSLLARARQSKPLLSVENLNEKFERMAKALQATVFDEKSLKAETKERKKRLKAEKKIKEDKKRIFVLDFNGDLRASQVENLREEITSLLTIIRPAQDEVVIRLESPGGMVHSYGLAAAQLGRIRSANIHLTVCVDKVAASGGYMMACTANRICSAPFAYIGSIGVAAELPNFNRLLKKYDVDYAEITAGEYKRTVSRFGPLTEKGLSKFQQDVEDIHSLFKGFVKNYRPQLEIGKVATGETWCGEQALALNLVDEICSSDEYLFRRRTEAKIFKVEIQGQKKWSEKLAENIASILSQSFERILERGRSDQSRSQI